MARPLPWRRRPCSAYEKQLDKSAETKLFVVQQGGPTSFVLRDEENNKFKTVLSEYLHCSCNKAAGKSSAAGAAATEHCVHTLFLMLKVFQMPVSNPLTWQISFRDIEIQDICNYREKLAKETAAAESRASKRKARQVDVCPPATAPIGYEDVKGVRKKLETSDVCPICHDTYISF